MVQRVCSYVCTYVYIYIYTHVYIHIYKVYIYISIYTRHLFPNLEFYIEGQHVESFVGKKFHLRKCAQGE